MKNGFFMLSFIENVSKGASELTFIDRHGSTDNEKVVTVSVR